MKENCAKTGEPCAVKANLRRMREQVRTPEEILVLDALQSSVIRLLERGNCSGPSGETGDSEDIFYSGVTVYCGSDKLPEIAERVDDAAEQHFLGYSELFEIENIGKIRGTY